MGFRGTLWRPDPQTTAALRRGKSKIERSGLVLTEKQAKEKSKARVAPTLEQQADAILGTPTDTLEADRQFGQPHYGH